jgi:23S rRNA (uracil1939-C5)-methyltransferase
VRYFGRAFPAAGHSREILLIGTDLSVQSIVTIEKLVFGGAGLARTAGGVVLVTDALPGETVRIEQTGKTGGVPAARAVEILAPSHDRRTPPCPYAGSCGGCDWQHCAYPGQVSAKVAIMRDCMNRIGRIRELPDIVSYAAEEFGYRHRVQFKVGSQREVGFFAKRSHAVIPIDRCPLLVDPLNKLLDVFPDRLASLPSPVETLMAIAGDNGKVASFPVLPSLTADTVTISAGDRKFEVAGNSFFQSNRPLLEPLGTWARGQVRGGRFVDLFGGSGFFSVMLADCFSEGILIESVAGHVEAAKRNFARNSIPTVRAVTGKAENVLSLIGPGVVDCLIVDPPRTGLPPAVLHFIAKLKPPMVLYVSCNPSTQARDAGFLISKAGYRITRAAMFDLYPNTYHMESILLFSNID